jgi:hypothetical protein
MEQAKSLVSMQLWVDLEEGQLAHKGRSPTRNFEKIKYLKKFLLGDT